MWVGVALLAHGEREHVVGAAGRGRLDHLLDGLRLGHIGQGLVGEQDQGLHRVRHAVGLAVVGQATIPMGDSDVGGLGPRSRQLHGEMEPFCTRFPIQSWAARIISGPLPPRLR